MKPNASILIIIAVSLIISTTLANDHLEREQAQLNEILSQIVQAKAEIAQFDAKLAEINRKITALESQNELNWMKRRRIVKLTEEKAALNAKRLIYYQQLLDNQNTARRISTELLDTIATIIDSTLLYINSGIATDERKGSLNYLMNVIEIRNRIIDSRSVYTQIENDVYPEKLNIQDYLQTAQSNPQIRNDLLNLMDEKISRITLMIETAKEEEMLQNRLEQFTLEMSSVIGEIDKEDINSFRTNKSADSPTEWTYTGPTDNDVNLDFNNWVSNTQPEILSSLSRFDYLPLIKSMEPTELPYYIFTLDSLRNYYIAEKQKLLKP